MPSMVEPISDTEVYNDRRDSDRGVFYTSPSFSRMDCGSLASTTTQWVGYRDKSLSTIPSSETIKKLGFAVFFGAIDFGLVTLTEQENRAQCLDTDSDILEVQSKDSNDEAEETNRKRVLLLCRKYAQSRFSKEEEARLAMETERLRKLIPRVVPEDYERLGEIGDSIRRLEKLNDELDELSKQAENP